MSYRQDYDDEPRRRPPADPRRPAGERSEAARRRERETLMQRRLRAARGEEIDDIDDIDDDYDDDYDDRPIYPLPDRYAPRAPAPTGCAGMVLYLLLAFLAVFVVVLLVGRQAVAGLLPRLNIPEQVGQVMASPTPFVRDRGGTIQQIRNLNRLETQSFSVERVIDAGVEGNPFQNLLFGDRILLIASGNVLAGVDLSKLGSNDVEISPDGTSITLRLPPSEIFQAALDNDRTRVYDRQRGLLATPDRDLETRARQAAEQEILNAACEGGIMQKAADEAQRSLEQFLRLLDFESVIVTSSAGPCTRSATVPVLPTAVP